MKMKKRRDFTVTLGMLALAFGILVSGCDNGSSPASPIITNAISLGATTTISDTASGHDTGSATDFGYYRKFGASWNFACSEVSSGTKVTVATDGSFSFPLDTPDTMDSLQNTLRGYATVSPGDTASRGITFFASVVHSSTTGKKLTLKSGSKIVHYLWVNQDATITLPGFVINLKAGWNQIIEDSSNGTAYGGSIAGFTWVVETYDPAIDE
ncbi:MAG: hypothetical protein LBB82_09775 [Treponema sp.]|jgi:hypothetical protein|nr:hypothetical protein [Treponema sp.]